MRFGIPPQWDRSPGDLRLEGRLAGGTLVGTIVNPDGRAVPFVGRRAPRLRRAMPAAWSAAVSLFNGQDLSGWVPGSFGRNYWAVRDGLLVNTGNEGANLLTVEKFQDFKLHVEFRYPRGGDGGVFLRGRYEVQIHDDAESEWPSELTNGAIYSLVIPNENASLGPDRWQTFDITLVGRRVTVVHNGKTVVADQIIPGLSGSALDADESAPGPVMLQGEETTIEFRNITISVPRADKPGPASATSSPASGCVAGDSAAAVATVRERLAEWVRQTNAGDRDGAGEVWAPRMVGWFPRASLFSDSAAYAAAGVAPSAQPPRARTTFDVVVDDIVASGSVVIVHDVWTETRDVAAPARAVQRVIRGSELWRCQPDGRWRIVRYVSAPEPWTVVRARGTP
jgi:ketosteroid isomerase-like protein